MQNDEKPRTEQDKPYVGRDRRAHVEPIHDVGGQEALPDQGASGTAAVDAEGGGDQGDVEEDTFEFGLDDVTQVDATAEYHRALSLVDEKEIDSPQISEHYTYRDGDFERNGRF